MHGQSLNDWMTSAFENNGSPHGNVWTCEWQRRQSHHVREGQNHVQKRDTVGEAKQSVDVFLNFRQMRLDKLIGQENALIHRFKCAVRQGGYCQRAAQDASTSLDGLDENVGKRGDFNGN